MQEFGCDIDELLATLAEHEKEIEAADAEIMADVGVEPGPEQADDADGPPLLP